MVSGTQPLRVGILGAAPIAPTAVVRPARALPEVEVVAIASREPARARRFAARHQSPTVHEPFDALLGDRRVEAVDDPTPDGRTGRVVAAGCRVARPVVDVRVLGGRGLLKVFDPTAPQHCDRVTLRTQDGIGRRRIAGRSTCSTYRDQPRAFVAVREGGPVLTPPADAVRNRRVIDAISEAAGMLSTPVGPPR